MIFFTSIRIITVDSPWTLYLMKRAWKIGDKKVIYSGSSSLNYSSSKGNESEKRDEIGEDADYQSPANEVYVHGTLQITSN